MSQVIQMHEKINFERKASALWNRECVCLCSGLVELLLTDNTSTMGEDLREAVAEAVAECTSNECETCNGTGELNTTPQKDDDIGSDSSWLEDCDDCEGRGHHEPEIYEWYFVTAWLADRLKQHGEVILRGDVLGMCVPIWGRQCSGQDVHVDFVIEHIASESS